MPVTPFASDLAFLRSHTSPLVLGEAPGPQIVVAPEYQGRVLTSTVGGESAPSFGWLGRAAISSHARQPHMNVFGGEDRFWLGPEGGQFALYFKKGDAFDLAHWQTPEGFDWGPWDVVTQAAAGVQFRKRLSLRNYSDTPFEIEVNRTVRLLAHPDILVALGIAPAPAVRAVAFESWNAVKNTGTVAWRPETGLVSTWILGMFNPSPATTIAIPYVQEQETRGSGLGARDSGLGPIVNDAYFGKVPADRLIVAPSAILFRGDGQFRSKIGLSPSRATPVAGSYDATAHVLTLVQYTRPAGATRYVNSMWAVQQNPYDGDVINSYNDGPPAPGAAPLGPFYELETSSPALGLAPAEEHVHVHRTIHLAGPEADLDAVARAVLKMSLAEIAGAFKAPSSR
jgi:hypothetical protein